MRQKPSTLRGPERGERVLGAGAPAIFVEDAALLAHLLDADAARIAGDPAVTGRAYGPVPIEALWR
jgi:hypothetical protein